MKQKLRSLLLGLVFLAGLMCFTTIPVQAAGVREVASIGYDDKNSISVDLTGDGKAETIKISKKTDEYMCFITKVKFKIGKNTILTLKPEEACYMSVRYISMSDTKNFLQIQAHGMNDYITFNTIYRYDAKEKKLVSAVDLLKSQPGSHDVIKATSKKIVVENYDQPVEIGYVRWTCEYTYKNGSFKVKSYSNKATSQIADMNPDETYYSRHFAKNEFRAKQKLTFYTGIDCKTKAFTVKKKQWVTLKKIYQKGSKTFALFENSKGKSGWLPVDVYSQNSYNTFYDVSNRLAG